jgi:hypothetical protein
MTYERKKNNKIWVKVEQKRAINQKIEHYYDNNNNNDDEETVDINSHTHTHVRRCLSNMNENNDTSSLLLSSLLSSSPDTLRCTTSSYM